MLIATIVLTGFGHGAIADVSRLITLESPRGTTQRLLIIVPKDPIASVILFAGGHGALGLSSPNGMKWGKHNFLVRTRHRFAEHGFIVALIDAPSDRRNGMKLGFRTSKAHADDIAAATHHLKKIAAVPVWLIGTSRGTISAANAAIRNGDIAGLVLTSSITRTKPKWRWADKYPYGLLSMALEHIKAPTLIVAHRDDKCRVTPPTGAMRIRSRLANKAHADVRMMSGGKPAQSKPCKARSPHGFFGIEAETVGKIANFIRRYKAAAR